MLPPAHRLRRSSDFQATVRRGVRAGSGTVVVHMLPGSREAGSFGVPQVGFVVSKAVGNAVHRNKVKRRLRAASVAELVDIPSGTTVVVRALPASAGASFDNLRSDLHRTVAKVSSRLPAAS